MQFNLLGESDEHLKDKILSGHVDYPFFVSPKAKDLMSHMMSVEPRERLSIQGVSENSAKN